MAPLVTTSNGLRCHGTCAVLLGGSERFLAKLTRGAAYLTGQGRFECLVLVCNARVNGRCTEASACQKGRETGWGARSRRMNDVRCAGPVHVRCGTTKPLRDGKSGGIRGQKHQEKQHSERQPTFQPGDRGLASRTVLV